MKITAMRLMSCGKDSCCAKACELLIAISSINLAIIEPLIIIISYTTLQGIESPLNEKFLWVSAVGVIWL